MRELVERMGHWDVYQRANEIGGGSIWKVRLVYGAVSRFNIEIYFKV